MSIIVILSIFIARVGTDSVPFLPPKTRTLWNSTAVCGDWAYPLFGAENARRAVTVACVPPHGFSRFAGPKLVGRRRLGFNTDLVRSVRIRMPTGLGSTAQISHSAATEASHTALTRARPARTLVRGAPGWRSFPPPNLEAKTPTTDDIVAVGDSAAPKTLCANEKPRSF
jgi:hypothetical protein